MEQDSFRLSPHMSLDDLCGDDGAEMEPPNQSSNSSPAVNDIDKLETAALVEPVAGVRPQCGLTCELTNAFCEESCGTTLTDSCPGCSESILVWVKFCGSCGVDVKQKLIDRGRQLEREMRKIKELRRGKRYKEMESRLHRMLGFEHSQLAPCRQWAEQVLGQTKLAVQRTGEKYTKLYGYAREQFDANNYAGSLHFLNQIPAAAREKNVLELIEITTRASNEVEKLVVAVEATMKSGDWDLLETQLKRFRELKPNDPHLGPLLEQLEHGRRKDIKRNREKSRPSKIHLTIPFSEKGTNEPKSQRPVDAPKLIDLGLESAPVELGSESGLVEIVPESEVLECIPVQPVLAELSEISAEDACITLQPIATPRPVSLPRPRSTSRRKFS
jgi:hypothetical protein